MNNLNIFAGPWHCLLIQFLLEEILGMNYIPHPTLTAAKSG